MGLVPLGVFEIALDVFQKAVVSDTVWGSVGSDELLSGTLSTKEVASVPASRSPVSFRRVLRSLRLNCILHEVLLFVIIINHTLAGDNSHTTVESMGTGKGQKGWGRTGRIYEDGVQSFWAVTLSAWARNFQKDQEKTLSHKGYRGCNREIPFEGDALHDRCKICYSGSSPQSSLNTWFPCRSSTLREAFNAELLLLENLGRGLFHVSLPTQVDLARGLGLSQERAVGTGFASALGEAREAGRGGGGGRLFGG